MKYLIIELPDTDVISVTVEPQEVISINYAVAFQSDAGTPPQEPTRREFSFVDADLNGQNRITFVHNLGGQDFVDYKLWAPQFEDAVTPDKTIYAVNQLTIELSTFRPLVDTWKIMIERN